MILPLANKTVTSPMMLVFAQFAKALIGSCDGGLVGCCLLLLGRELRLLCLHRRLLFLNLLLGLLELFLLCLERASAGATPAWMSAHSLVRSL